MEIKVLWTDTALYQIEDIFEFYKFKASLPIAKKTVKSIIEKTTILETNPLLGVKDPLLLGRPYEYRFLVKGNYKIIYRFNDNLIRIISVFDCRQNPVKIEEIND